MGVYEDFPWLRRSREVGIPGVPDARCLAAHEVVGKHVVYRDGVISTYCINCGDRINLERVPGGLDYLKAVESLSRAMTADDGEAIGLLAELNRLETDISVAEKGLRRARSLLNIARRSLSGEIIRDTEAVLDLGADSDT